MEKKRKNCVMQQKKQAKKQQHVVKKVVKVVNEEEDEKISEDYCFVCKDGGTLIVCDHKDCVKAFHPACVGLDESTEETDDLWICDWHRCLECKRSSKYQCYCCTNAVCQSCLKNVSFARVRGSKGLCNDCLHLALLGDEGLNVDSDGETVDFKDHETYECLFKEYWDIIKEKEGLTLDDLHDADIQIKKSENAKVKPLNPQYEPEKSVELEENREPILDDHNSNDHDSERAVKPVIVTNNKRPKETPKRKRGSSGIEYIGWASKSLIEFLAAIGVDTDKKLSQNDVSSRIRKYAKENKLFHPEKSKIILCDARLRPLLKSRTISIDKINDGIKAHFLENLEQSEDDGYIPEKYATLPTKKLAWLKSMGPFQHKGSLLGKFLEKEVIPEEPKKVETVAKLVHSDFATIVPQNIKLVYLKRGLVESLLENYETFESKVTGSFVKVNLGPGPVDPKHPYQLFPVTGIRKAFGNENKTVLLQVSNLPYDISMGMLSNDDISLDDCKGLQQKIEAGFIPKLTVVELEKKAKDLQEDITKYEKEANKQQHEVKKVVEEEEEEEKVSEDYCFVCKDGGTLIVCDHKDCVKAYHPDCVGLDESTEETDVLWICDWHSCLECKRSSKYQCYCCTNAVCQSCFKKVSFARVRGSKGLCNDCVHLALLGDEGLDVDSDGETVDFKDRETYEGLFKEYWDIIKEKEGLTLDDLHDADVQIKKGENSKVKPLKPQYESDKSVELEENGEPMLDDHNSDDYESERAVKSATVSNNKRPKKTPKRKRGSSRIEYIGWASKTLIEFLAAIGVDTNNKLSQSDVSSLIQKYAKENNLFHPEKRKIILCDARLRPLLRRRTISIYKINDGIEAHFFENLEQSEDDGYSSGYEEEYATVPTKKQAWWKNMGSFSQKGPLMEKFLQKEVILEEPKKIETVTKIVYSNFATVVPQNMKLVYLKRGLVESLLENYETFESKVMGSFVKVKLEPVNPKNPYQLLPVTGIKKECGNDNKIVLLQVSNLPNDISMRMLANEDISLEDCECLQQKIEAGLIPKLTVVELEKKAKDLHEDITKHVIARELTVLKHRIDHANEKGWRAELYEYRKRRELLQSEEEQARMLNELPSVIADVIEVKPDSEDPESNITDVGTCPSINLSEISQDCKKTPA